MSADAEHADTAHADHAEHADKTDYADHADKTDYADYVDTLRGRAAPPQSGFIFLQTTGGALPGPFHGAPGP